MTDALVVLDDEPRDDERLERSGWARRLLVLGEGGRRGSVVRTLGVLGAASFLVSLLLDWQTITVHDLNGQVDDSSSGSITVGFGVGDQASFGLVYLFGVIGLLAIGGAVLNRPDAAARLRSGVIGGAVGVLAVLVAITSRLNETIVGVPQGLQAVFGNIQVDNGRYQFGYAPGLIFAYAAVVLPTVAIWLAARTDAGVPQARFARRKVAEPSPTSGPEVAADVVGPAALPEYQRRRNDGPIDLTVTPG